MRLSQILPFSFVLLLLACTPNFEDINHSVLAVHDGQTLELKNGSLISLIGVKGSQQSQQYLEENVLGKKVNIRFDSNAYPAEISPGVEIPGYVQLLNGQSLNGLLIKRKIASIDLSGPAYDSLSSFEFYAEGKVTSRSSRITRGSYSDDDKSYQPQGPSLTSGLGNLVERVEKSVFLVSTYDQNGNGMGQGTGFFVGLNGYAVSNYHVFENGSQWEITTYDQRKFHVEEVVRSSKEYDYVIFKVGGDLSDYPTLKIAPNRSPRKADDIFVVGNPRGLESTFTRGAVSALRAIDQTGDIIQFDAAISPGSSGSPVMNMKGEVLGIATMKVQGCENCNFAMNIHLLDLN